MACARILPGRWISVGVSSRCVLRRLMPASPESMNWSETNISGKVFLPAASCATALCGDSLFAYGGVAQVDFNGRTTEAVGAGLYHISLSTNACTRIYPVRSIPPIPDVSIPPALLGASLLHVPSLSDPDPLKGRIYLFGGMDAGGIVNSDLWIFDLGGNRKEGWTRVRTPNSKDNMMWPGIRVGHQCALWIDRDEKDPHKRRRLVLHGGTAPPDAIPTQRRSDIWTLDIGMLLSAGPGRRSPRLTIN